MDTRHASFANLMDLFAGRADAAVARHLERCETCANEAQRARRLVEAGRRALTAPAPTRRMLKKAKRIFREAQRGERTSLLRLVLDSQLRLAPALRAAATAAPPRFLRFEGEVTVELQVTRERGGVRLQGQITPSYYAVEVEVRAGTRRRRARVTPEGSFDLRGLPRGEAELRVGASLIRGLTL